MQKVSKKRKTERVSRFPFAASVLDDLREQFGTGVKLVWAAENGAEIGRPLSGDFCVLTPYQKASAIKKRVGR